MQRNRAAPSHADTAANQHKNVYFTWFTEVKAQECVRAHSLLPTTATSKQIGKKRRNEKRKDNEMTEKKMEDARRSCVCVLVWLAEQRGAKE